MITARGTEFEIPGLTKETNRASVLKTVPLNKHLIVMTSGDAGFQTDAVQHLYTKINPDGLKLNAPADDAFSQLRVRDAATYYLEFCNEQRRRAANSFFAPYGLDVESYIAKQKSMSDGFVTWVSQEIEAIRERIGDPVLFCGVDATGAHIIQCDGNRLAVCDSFAFAAIGSGGDHAESQFMLANHTRFASIAETILLTYVAKKRSEVAQGVGEQTDMFVISGTPAGYFYVTAEQFEKLDAVYRTLEQEQSKAFDRAKAKITKYVNELAQQAADAANDSVPQKHITEAGK